MRLLPLENQTAIIAAVQATLQVRKDSYNLLDEWIFISRQLCVGYYRTV